jgi:hypothetical protein
MTRFSRIILLALGFAIVPVVFFSMHGRTANAQSSFKGTTINSQVELFCNFFLSSSCTLNALASDGTTFAPFTVPAGKTLVITDLECTIQTATSGEIGLCGLMDQLTAVAPSGDVLSDKILLVQAGAPSGPINSVLPGHPGFTSVISLHLTTGIRVTYVPAVMSNNVGTPPHAQSITVQGYLIP